jgi:hypothetical protein
VIARASWIAPVSTAQAPKTRNTEAGPSVAATATAMAVTVLMTALTSCARTLPRFPDLR